MFELKEGMLIPVSEELIGTCQRNDYENPICHAIGSFMRQSTTDVEFSCLLCLIDEEILIFKNGQRIGRLYTTTMLEDWYRAYLNGKNVSPFTLKLFYQDDEKDTDKLWIGIVEDGEGVSSKDLVGLSQFVSVADIQRARESMETKKVSRIVQDYVGECPVTNALLDMVSDLCLEVGVDGEQAELYNDDTRQCFILPLTAELRSWQSDFYLGYNVPVGVINIFVDGEQLVVGIQYNFGDHLELSACDLIGMEGVLTRWHINEGIRGNCEHCPIALVLSEMFPNYEVNVDGSVASIHVQGNVHVSLELSESVAYWIDAYDQENDVGTLTLIIRDNPDGKETDRYLLDIKALSERQKDLQQRISKLSVVSADMVLLRSNGEHDIADSKLREYQDLFSQTVADFGN